MMQNCKNRIEDESAEILLSTDVERPRGHSTREKQMTSFETLVHTALALKNDPRNEHSYAAYRLPEKRMVCEGLNKELKDHCYYFGSTGRIPRFSHRRAQSLSVSEENLTEDTTNVNFYYKQLIQPQYLSNDSALDVTGFDSMSEKCQSFGNLQSVEMLETQCILPGISDPDLSRMSIQTQFEVNTLAEVSGDKRSPDDRELELEHNKHSLLKDHAYNAGAHRKKDSLPVNSGVKRGHSNDDLIRLNHNYFKRKDFKNSPFLDHSYQSLEVQHGSLSNNAVSRNIRGKNSVHPESAKLEIVKKNSNQSSQLQHDTASHSVINVVYCPKQLFLDHTYEEFVDASANISFSEFMEKLQEEGKSGVQHSPLQTKTDRSDHSYVIKRCVRDFDCSSLSSSVPSDSGTESLKDEELDENPDTFEVCLKEHKYSKDTNARGSEADAFQKIAT